MQPARELHPTTILVFGISSVSREIVSCEILSQVANEVDGKQEAGKKQRCHGIVNRQRKQTNETIAEIEIYEGCGPQLINLRRHPHHHHLLLHYFLQAVLLSSSSC
jgi:hypothetical protein